jgi:hypothetical protein
VIRFCLLQLLDGFCLESGEFFFEKHVRGFMFDARFV